MIYLFQTLSKTMIIVMNLRFVGSMHYLSLPASLDLHGWLRLFVPSLGRSGQSSLTQLISHHSFDWSVIIHSTGQSSLVTLVGLHLHRKCHVSYTLALPTLYIHGVMSTHSLFSFLISISFISHHATLSARSTLQFLDRWWWLIVITIKIDQECYFSRCWDWWRWWHLV